METAPALGENVGEVHPAEMDTGGVAATLIWAGDVGSVSVKLTPLTADALELVIAMDKVDVPPPAIDTGEKDLVIVSGEVIVATRLEDEKSLL